MNSKPSPAPVFMGNPSKYIGPFCDEVRQRLGLDGFASRVCEGLPHELNRPFGDPPSGLLILDDLAQRKG